MVEEVENRWKQDIPNFFMYVKVAFPLSKPFRRGAFLVGSNGQRTWVTVNMRDFFCSAITATCLGMTLSIVLNTLWQLRMLRKQNVNMENG